jgi:exodeoxyribonuclease VII small subunit
MKKENGGLNYASAYQELCKTLEALEQGDIGVDELSAKVKRAAELIEFCQKRLKETELEVQRVVDSFQKQLETAEGDEEEEDDAEEDGEPKLF